MSQRAFSELAYFYDTGLVDTEHATDRSLRQSKALRSASYPSIRPRSRAIEHRRLKEVIGHTWLPTVGSWFSSHGNWTHKHQITPVRALAITELIRYAVDDGLVTSPRQD
jgi:hypothetical protein